MTGPLPGPLPSRRPVAWDVLQVEAEALVAKSRLYEVTNTLDAIHEVARDVFTWPELDAMSALLSDNTVGPAF